MINNSDVNCSILLIFAEFDLHFATNVQGQMKGKGQFYRVT